LVLVWRGGLSKKADLEKVLREKYPQLDFKVLELSRSQPLSDKARQNISAYAPAIIFCAFGSPYQEKFIFHNLHNFSSLRLALGVGGSFDFISGKVRRANIIFRKLGLEWLWRLILQPRRWRRIYRATVVFTHQIIRAEMKHFFYRPNVACLFYKNTPTGYKILIVEREDEANHWQLPQGGTEGESLKVAGSREMHEELNTKNFIVKATFKNTFSYLFPPVFNQQGKRLSFKYEYKGQRQGLCIAEFLGQDKEIKVNFWDHRAFKWVDDEDFVRSVHPVRQEAAKIFLEKFRSLNL
jgi:8-oxo-dGTP pyrophosphatase MutT (NUDIX family)